MDRWEYLLTPPYRLRHAIAAHLVADCPAVVDVGAYRVLLPVNGKTLYSIDPLATIDGTHHCTVGEFWQHHHDLRGFGLVVLGVDVNGGMGEMHALWDMIEAASATVLEWATTHRLGAEQAAWLLRGRTPSIDITLHLPDVNSDGFPAQGERRLVCLTT